MDSKPLDLTLPLTNQCSPKSVIVPYKNCLYDIEFKNERATLNYWTNVSVKQFLEFFCSSNNLNSTEKYRMKVGNEILPDSLTIPFSGYSSLIYIYCLDTPINIQFKNEVKKISVSLQMTIGDIRTLFYEKCLATIMSRSEFNFYKVFGLNKNSMKLLDNAKPLEAVPRQEFPVLTIAELLYVKSKGSLKVFIKSHFKTVGEFLQVEMRLKDKL